MQRLNCPSLASTNMIGPPFAEHLPRLERRNSPVTQLSPRALPRQGKAEHEALLAKQAEAGPGPLRVLSAEDSAASLRATEGGAALVNEWAAEAPAKVRAVQQSTLEMLNAMGDQQVQGAFMFGVSQLPGQIQTGFARELSSPAPGNVSPAAAEAVAEYKAYGVVEKWGADAPVRVARAEARVQRMLKDLPAGNRVAALEWFRSLPANQAAAIIEQLSR